jgi:hypothetical protein
LPYTESICRNVPVIRIRKERAPVASARTTTVKTAEEADSASANIAELKS